GLDYPGVGPEHSYWRDSGRVEYTACDDSSALESFYLCSRMEGILPALETAHAIKEAMRIAASRPHGDIVVVCLSGRGDKDCYEIARLSGQDLETASVH
ncbi:MAG: tryptophan synthase subunit beta, partial [Planctomycetota bacterium]